MRPPPQRLTAVWLFILGVLGIETALRVLPEGFMTRTVQHRAEEIRYLPPADIQLMGDSATSAIRAALLEHFIGPDYQVSNYALPGTSPLFNYFVLRRQLEANKAPRLIVLAPHPFVWGDPLLDRFLGRFATPRESLEMLGDGVKLSEWLYGTLCRFSYTLRYREEFYKALTAGDVTFFRRLASPITSVQNTRAKITEAESSPSPPLGSVLAAHQLPPLLTRPIKVHPYNELYLDKFCTLAAAHGIQILWLSLPLPELIVRQGDGDQRTAAYADLIARVKARHKNVAVLSEAVPTLPDSHYLDAWHMNAYGAWVFTHQAGEQLANWLAAHPLPAAGSSRQAAR
ncbi:MAG: hypothetical protein N3I86_08505 [Verrucomicrobiae bacterium]|nr:hypothetical protein [Verrucomicrobiae bacterium]